MKKLSFIAIILFIFIISCKDTASKFYLDENNTIVAEVNIHQRKENVIYASEFIDSVDRIKLETTDESLISKIAKVIIEDGLIFIQDIKTRSVLIFDITGKYKNKILKVGQGPGEYSEISTLMVDNKNKHLIIYDVHNRKMIYYTFDGSFVKEITNFSGGRVARDVINLPNENFLCYFPDKKPGDTERFELWEVDSDGKFVNGLLKHENAYPHVFNETSSYFYKISENKVGLMDPNLTSIYHYENDTLSRYLSYKLDVPTMASFPNQPEAKDHYSILYSYEKGDYILSEWLDDEGKYFAMLFSKKDNIITTGRTISYQKEIFGKIVNSNQSNIIVMEIPSTFILDDLTSEYAPQEIKDKLKEITSGMTNEEIEEMNPILQFLYVKQSKGN